MSDELWTIIVASADGLDMVSSVQCVLSTGSDAEDAARRAFEANDWMRDFCLVAAVRGLEPVLTRDDARTAEYGLK